MKYWPRTVPSVIVALSLTLAALVSAPAALAAGTNITGGTYGASCNSGGYFTPSSVSVTTGDTVTISVPSNDPYSGGIQVHGFPEGNFTILPGSSHTTAALSANVSYYGTWPNTGCMKGTGSITVTAASTPTPPPAATPTPKPAAGVTSTKTPTPSPQASAGPSTTPTAAAGTSPSANAGAATPTPAPADSPAATASTAKPMSQVLAATVGGGGLVLLALIGLAVWRFVIKRRLRPPAPPPPTTPPSIPPASPPTAPPTI